MLCGTQSMAAQLRGSSLCASRRNARVGVKAQATTTTVSKAEANSAQGEKQEIYIGFEKGDYAPRQGRKGRVIKDDARKYPQRNEVTGGWAGGEVGLKAFVAEVKDATPAPSSKLEAKEQGAKPIGRGADTIYIGYSKEDLEARRTGQKGRVIKDDARKYPQRNEVTGGFAGGELGLKKFVEIGDVPIAEPGKGGRQPQSPLVIAGVLGGAAVVGGLLLFNAEEAAEQVLQGAPVAVKATGLDESTKTLLQGAVVLAGLTGAVAGGRAIVSAAANSLREGAVKLGTLSLFWVTVFLAAQYVLTSP